MVPTMSNNIQPSLKTIAETVAADYISSVLIVDDVITYENNANESAIPAQIITDHLAKNHINSCFYRCKKEEQRDAILNLLRINDICVLDWRMNVERVIDSDRLDEDVLDNEGRGHFTKSIINAVLNDSSFKPQLLFVYTAEPGEVQDYLLSLESEFHGSKCDASRYFWTSADSQIRICVYFKEGISDGHGIDASRVIAFDKIVPILLKEFACLHEGILPITLLRSLSVIRKNINQLLSKYDKNLDSAFVIHRAMCPDPHAADNLLINTIADALSSLFSYQNMKTLAADNLIAPWLDMNSYKLDKLSIKKQPVDLSLEKRIKWHELGYPIFLREEYIATGEEEAKIPDKIHHYDKYKLSAEASFCFSPMSLTEEDIQKRHARFAILTHHKSIFGPAGYIPYLNLGCVIATDYHTGSGREHFLCIQQTCDCLRISESEERPFIFLPLALCSSGFDLVTYNNDVDDKTNPFIFLSVCKKASHDIRNFIFKPHEKEDIIKAEEQDNSYFFTDITGRKFHWLFDLKESFALRIVNEYAQKLTRVGIEESEWVRRSK